MGRNGLYVLKGKINSYEIALGQALSSLNNKNFMPGQRIYNPCFENKIKVNQKLFFFSILIRKKFPFLLQKNCS